MQDSTPGVTTLSRDSELAPADVEAVDVALAASGDGHAFERLYRRHVARVHSLARRMVDAEEADELTQLIFVRVWQKLGTYRGEAAFATWLTRLGINLILARRATLGAERKRYEEREGRFERLSSGARPPEFSIDFEAAMERLPVGAKQIFVLHDVEGYKHEEIAEMLGIAPGTSKAQLHRARMKLRERLAG